VAVSILTLLANASGQANKRVRASVRSLSENEIEDSTKTGAVGPGATGPRVVRAQILLDRARFSPGEIDGVYGDDFGIAVKGYQENHGLNSTGTIDAEMWRLLDSDAGSVARRNADATSFFFGNQRINDSARILFQRMSVGHAGNLIGKSISNFERLVVHELERIDGASFNDVLSERLHLAAIAVYTGRHPTLPLDLHRIGNVNRLAIEKHFASIGLRQRL
jgi:peptidoglycan hydrolase-like protein with peptidoglycan-binding domain